MSARVLRSWLAAAALSSAACGGAAGPLTATDDAPAVVAASADVRRAVARGAEEPRGATIELLARHNPASCECPIFEVYRYGAWLRSGLQPDRDAGEAVSGLLAAPPAAGRTVRLVVDAQPVDTQIAGDWTYPVWSVVAVVAPAEPR